MTPPYLGLAQTASLIALLLSFAFSWSFRRMGLVSHPNARSSHEKVTPVGVGLVVPIVVAALVLNRLGELPFLLVASLSMAALGYVEDLRELPPLVRIVGQFLVASLGILSMDLPWPLVPLLAVVVVAAVNGLNFMDGINGITASQGVLYGCVLATAAAVSSSGAWIVIGISLAGACLGYLPNNFPKAFSFPGDVLPYFLGAITVLGLLTMSTKVPVVLLGLGCLIPAALDTGTTLQRKFRDGLGLTAPHRSHAYQRLSRITSHATAMITFLALSSVGALSLPVAWYFDNVAAGLCWIAGSLLLTTWFVSRVPRNV